ncbi:S1 RNA-binding domain-containing protein [Lactobacillus acetotolerans]|nr:S1 RNA-binding domain-containing protein [Lactobacillus acetotolerans]
MMKYQVGKRVNGVINNIVDLGIFVTLPGRRSGLIHHSDFGNNWERERRLYQKGQEIRVVIMHNHKGRLSLSLMRVNDPKLVDPSNQFSHTRPADFIKVLTQTAEDAQTEIKQLRKELSKNAAY